jgi:glycosyltransferase involved in cell wall biosynthesis
MRIAILGSRGYPSTYGGFETFVRRLAPWLVEQGHELTVYGRGSGHRSEQVVDGVRVVNTRGIERKAAGTTTHGLTAAIDCARTRPDVVLALNVANGPALPLLRARKIPVVMNVDGIEWQRGKWGLAARGAFRLGARMSARFADVLVADSREVGRIWRARFGVDSVYIPYGADVIEDAREDRVLDLGLKPGTYALAVARLVPENNVGVFVDAIESLGDSVPAVVVGSATYSSPLEQRLDELARSGRILWLGHVADQNLLGELWAHAGVYFHGHSVGGTNPSLLQALGSGAPVVAVVAAELSRVLNDEDERQRRADAGRRIVATQYSWSGVLSDYEKTLRRAGGS